MQNREFVQLAHEYSSSKHGVGGFFMSEKLDGQRAIWDGGISRGKSKKDIPWANKDKDERYVKEQICTGLWSRYGNIIHAPDWFLDQLPINVMRDGELYNVQWSRQKLMSVIKTLEPTDEWKEVTYYTFDIPKYERFFMEGRIYNPNFKIIIREPEEYPEDFPHCTYNYIYKQLQQDISENMRPVDQEELPHSTPKAVERIRERLDEVTAKGGEGLILRSPHVLWVPKRTHNLLKVKKLQDAEAKVIGYTAGRKTDLGSKLLGKMGALIVVWEGKKFELSGFTEEEREFSTSEAESWAVEHPGEVMPDWVESGHFPKGSLVTFKYRGFTDDGLPQEARYWRKYS